MTARRPAEVSRVLRAAGIPVGYRYTQTGYVDRYRERVTEPGCEITRTRRGRYGGTEDAGCVQVFPVNPLANDCAAPPEFIARIIDALTAAGLPATRVGSLAIHVADAEERA